MKYLILLTTLTLAGCGASLPKTVNIPIAVSCVAQVPTKPELQYAPGTYTDVFSIVRDLKGDRILMEAYENELEAVIKGCK